MLINLLAKGQQVELLKTRPYLPTVRSTLIMHAYIGNVISINIDDNDLIVKFANTDEWCFSAADVKRVIR